MSCTAMLIARVYSIKHRRPRADLRNVTSPSKWLADINSCVTAVHRLRLVCLAHTRLCCSHQRSSWKRSEHSQGRKLAHINPPRQHSHRADIDSSIPATEKRTEEKTREGGRRPSSRWDEERRRFKRAVRNTSSLTICFPIGPFLFLLRTSTTFFP